jgi:hypothetical protein
MGDICACTSVPSRERRITRTGYALLGPVRQHVLPVTAHQNLEGTICELNTNITPARLYIRTHIY